MRLCVGESPLQSHSAVREWPSAEIFVSLAQEIPQHEGGRALFGEKLDARCSRMDAELQGLEVEAGLTGDDELSVDHRSGRELLQDRGFELGKVAIQGFEVTALQEPLATVSEEQHTEPVPLRLVEPSVTRG